jgi:hypothetical protein
MCALLCCAMQASEMSPKLEAEFAAFHRFCTVRFFGAQSEPIAEVTAAKYADHLRCELVLAEEHTPSNSACLLLVAGRFFATSCATSSWLAATACRGMLGWLHRQRGVPLEALSLSQLLPSSGREGVAVVFDYVLWLHSARNISMNTEGLVVSGSSAHSSIQAQQ